MIFQTFNTGSDIVSGRVQSITSGVWSDGDSVATTFYTLTGQTLYTGSSPFDVLNGAYYYNIYDLDPNAVNSSAQVKFSIAYGNAEGSGSITDLNAGSTLVTQTVYNQFRNILLTPNDSVFTFLQSGSSAGYSSNDFYAISFAASAFQEQLDPGAIQFNLAGANGTFSFIDDSLINSSTTGIFGQVYNIVNGSIETGLQNYYDSQGRGFGLFYPDLGIILLNPVAIADLVGDDLSPNLGTDKYYQNQGLLLTAIVNGQYFQATSTEFVPTTHYFVRVQNQLFNYSNNPTFVLNSNNSSNPSQYGQLLFPSFVNDPQVYITTVGLYDNNNELVAVAKLSTPVLKNFENETLIKIKLDF